MENELVGLCAQLSYNLIYKHPFRLRSESGSQEQVPGIKFDYYLPTCDPAARVHKMRKLFFGTHLINRDWYAKVAKV